MNVFRCFLSFFSRDSVINSSKNFCRNFSIDYYTKCSIDSLQTILWDFSENTPRRTPPVFLLKFLQSLETLLEIYKESPTKASTEISYENSTFFLKILRSFLENLPRIPLNYSLSIPPDNQKLRNSSEASSRIL